MKHISLFVSIILFSIFSLSAQEYAVKSFEIVPDDFSARTNSRIDYNGRKCALVKINVPDKIVEVLGSVVGDIEVKGLQKWVYLTPDTKKIEVFFENHLPLMITFRDFNYPTVSTEMVYRMDLAEVASSPATQKEPSASPRPPVADPSHTAINGNTGSDNGNDALPSNSVKENTTLTGIVTSAEDSDVLIGCTVMRKKPYNAAYTNVDGQFMLKDIKPGDTIEFSYIGYKTFELTLTGKIPAFLDVSLHEGKGVERKEFYYDPDDTSKYYDLKGNELSGRPTAKGTYLRIKDGKPERLEIK